MESASSSVRQRSCPTRVAADRTTTARSTLISHHIETHGQDAAAIFARTDPWHRLGVTVAGDAFEPVKVVWPHRDGAESGECRNT